MHVADSDFRELTKGKKLTSNGDMNPEVFEQIMREQIRLYTQVALLLFQICSYLLLMFIRHIIFVLPCRCTHYIMISAYVLGN